MMSSAFQLLWDLQAELGEGPVWDDARQCLWFVDIKGRSLHRYEPASRGKATWVTPDQTGFALPAEDGSLICGVRGGLHRFDPATAAFTLVQEVEADRPQNRLNDGFVAPDGSLWFGTMDDSEEVRSGALYRWEKGRLSRKGDGYGVVNGPAMCPAGKTLYVHDTLEKRIYAFDHENGEIGGRRRFAETPDGYPDGLAVDSEGVLHVGLFNGSGVAKFSPAGERLGTLSAPVQTVTKGAFGGPDLRDFYMTTAWLGNADRRVQQPTLGGLYRTRLATPGLPQALIRL